MANFPKRGIGIAVVAFLLLGITAIAFAAPPRGGVKNVGNCSNSWTRVWNANVTLDGIGDGSYSADLVGGDFNALKNLALKGCQMEVLITTETQNLVTLYQCNKVDVTPWNFTCYSSGTEPGSDASGLSVVYDPIITIKNEEAITEGGVSSIFLNTDASSSTGEPVTFTPIAFSGVGGTGQVIVFTKK